MKNEKKRGNKKYVEASFMMLMSFFKTYFPNRQAKKRKDGFHDWMFGNIGKMQTLTVEFIWRSNEKTKSHAIWANRYESKDDFVKKIWANIKNELPVLNEKGRACMVYLILSSDGMPNSDITYGIAVYENGNRKKQKEKKFKLSEWKKAEPAFRQCMHEAKYGEKEGGD